ncbi:DUF4097 family beta strand repeat-containing protein [Streptococcus sp. 20-1249]|uniref:DUF4097 family beta strand repeat-containing protein n=1 Tax=Streptococcus hepaticus TaxID=3349163 RepID=UPI003749D2A0
MNKQEYLSTLAELLQPLEAQERADVLDYFNEYFDECQNYAEAIENLGSPQEAAKDILENLGVETHSETEKDFTKNYSNTSQENSQTNFQENFLSSFLEKFRTSFQQDKVEKQQVLERFDNLTISGEECNLIVESTDQPQASIVYWTDERESLPFTIKQSEGGLSISTLQHDRSFLSFSGSDKQSPRLLIPSETLQTLKLHLKDSNITLLKLNLQKLAANMEDSNLTLKQTSIASALLQLEDSNISLAESSLLKLDLKMEDSNLSAKETGFEQFTIHSEDSNLQLEESSLSAGRITLTESRCNLQNGQFKGEIDLHCEDSQVNLLLTNFDQLECQINQNDSMIHYPSQNTAQTSKTAWLDLKASDSIVNIAPF